jgi:hypothetical protein
MVQRLQRAFAGHLNRGIDGVFQRRDLVSIAEVHAIVAGASAITWAFHTVFGPFMGRSD